MDLETRIKLQKSKRMTEEIKNICHINQDILDVMAHCDREMFVPKGFGAHAYKLDALPLVADQWISSPLTVAKMTQALYAKGIDNILEIGCGSGYQALILSKLARRVFSIERVERLAKEAKEKFKHLGIHNVNVRYDDGQNGWRNYAPYDRILFSASIKQIPASLFAQLKVGGIAVAPIEKEGKQIITQFTKTEHGIEKREFDDCLFVPIVDGKSH
ncbi:protein-L-isoaspartate(D-aspartate) O-methyltransferase [Sulfurospirillum sp. 1612]|uniref:protein-L-isoaspartate(D-aspartate) O-methyltransferase n=1 Tax=Sulfurospirillum sp. 1612 TaxID=3094835 RepID=UPI002F9200E0